MTFSGGCVCGAVRYEFDGEPIVMFKCHCRDCQHVSGGAFSPVVYVPKNSLKITKGALRYHTTPSLAFEQNRRGFCAQCGSRISGGETDDGIGITAGSLDDPGIFHPQMHMHATDAQQWDVLETGIPRFDLYPPM